VICEELRDLKDPSVCISTVETRDVEFQSVALDVGGGQCRGGALSLGFVHTEVKLLQS
jgi:hypothetical protein